MRGRDRQWRRGELQTFPASVSAHRPTAASSPSLGDVVLENKPAWASSFFSEGFVTAVRGVLFVAGTIYNHICVCVDEIYICVVPYHCIPA